MTTEPITISGARLLAELVAVTTRLSELLEQENRLLEAPGLPKLDHIVPEKLKLSARYDGLMQVLRLQPHIDLKSEPEAPRLAEAVARLGRLAKVNAKTVDIHLKATRRVLDLVAHAAKKATTTTFTYGKERLGYGARCERHPSIAVNRLL